MHLVLKLLAGELAILKLPREAAVPSWLNFSTPPLVSLTRTAEETSVICPTSAVPSGIDHEPGWRAFKVNGKLEFSAVGILAAILAPLADAGISILSISTFDTDYILVRSHALEQAKIALRSHFQLEA